MILLSGRALFHRKEDHRTKNRSSRQAKQKEFSRKTVEEIVERDRGCIFCRAGRWPGGDAFWETRYDIAHIVNRSQGGLGIITNGVMSCRNHHHMLDNGNQGFRQELLKYAKDYLKELYPGWTEEQQVYRKYDF